MYRGWKICLMGAMFTGLAVGMTAQAQVVIFTEDFESLVLGPNVDEGPPQEDVWTKKPPIGWNIDDSGVPGAGTDNDGVTEWAGWSFADKDFWIASDGQRREEFLLGQGIIAVVDPDEWDDLPHESGLLNSFLSTPSIPIAGLEENSITLTFDSSWRDEDSQKVNITVSFDGGDEIEILRWVSTPADDQDFHDDFPNETVKISIDNPANAKTMVVTFGMIDAGNDWWWAIDNIEMTGNAGSVDQVVFEESDTSTTIFEQDTTSDTFTVKLAQAPSSDVTVTLDPNDGAHGEDFNLVAGGQAGPDGTRILQFTQSNWDTPQTVTVQAVDDTIEEGLEIAFIVTIVSSADTNFNNSYIKDLPLINLVDNDGPGLNITETDLATVVREGDEQSDTFLIQLTKEPKFDVTANLTESTDPNQVTLDPASLTFTPANWSTPQEVTVTAIDDDVLELDPHNAKISFSISSSDLDYSSLELDDFLVKVEENECGAWGFNHFDITGPEGVSDCIVDMLDFSAFAGNWMICTRPHDLECVDNR